MTCKEFSEEFDTLLDSYGESQKTEQLLFDEYEKSVFLTKAQENVVVQLYNGKLTGQSFEETEEMRRYLQSLIKTESLSPLEDDGEHKGLSENSIFFKLPKGVLFRTFEQAILQTGDGGCMDGSEVEVLPVTQDQYHRIKNNPFRGANDRRVLRMDYGDDTVEIVSKHGIKEYRVRYLETPSPIILIDLPDNLTINHESNKAECRLHPVLHRTILEVAVRLAIGSRGITGKQ